ncbi:hypothetical protein CAEBREN_10557 [Caenorhabditis brenneri]|uniref:Uncharacterized protein n=1 Tax=Caenorhabditis brenneri TaxID=135651 RepID=G0MQ45_CAEBE|nr:hypothetical protein CAEBREN_10557 [Caenorhabditis brenneri]
MKQSSLVTLFTIFVTSFASNSTKCQKSSFQLTYSEDKKAFHSRHFHIFYERGFKSLAENLECQLIDTVKKVTVEEIEGNTLAKICESKVYASKLEDKTKQRNYMTTITRQQTYSEEDVQCDAMNQFNLMQTPKKKWAVLIRGLATEILLPVSSKNGVFTKDGLDFALNSLFFATGYAFGDSTFKSLGGEGGVKGKLLYITAIVFIIVVFVAMFALVTLVVLYFMKRNAEIKKRENEKSKLLRNPANNTDSDTPVEIVYDNSPENNS